MRVVGLHSGSNVCKDKYLCTVHKVRVGPRVCVAGRGRGEYGDRDNRSLPRGVFFIEFHQLRWLYLWSRACEQLQELAEMVVSVCARVMGIE